MKSYKILLFILLVIAVLGMMTLVFPENGLQVGSLTLRFPSMEQILTHRSAAEQEADSLKIAEIQEMQLKDSLLHDIQDTLAVYEAALSTQEGRFYFPNDDLHFFASLYAKLQGAKANGKIYRILHYGDSQIEMDRISGNLREFFQGRFGGGGPGLMPAVQSIPSMAVSQSTEGNYSVYMAYGDGQRTRDGNYGIMAKNYRMSGSNTFWASASKQSGVASRVKRFSNIAVLFRDRDGDFSATLRNRKQGYDSSMVSMGEGLQLLRWNVDTPMTEFTFHFAGNADIYGIFADNGYGVSVDNIPMRGASGTIFTNIKDTLLQKSYQLCDVALIILQYGGNAMPGIGSQSAVNAYKERIGRQIAYLHRLYPQAKILFIGPADMAKKVNGVMDSYPFMAEMVQGLKEVALANGAAFWDMYSVMGGRRSMLAWYKNGLAGSDFVHFTPAGANKIGNILNDSFKMLFDYYDTEKQSRNISAVVE